MCLLPLAPVHTPRRSPPSANYQYEPFTFATGYEKSGLALLKATRSIPREHRWVLTGRAHLGSAPFGAHLYERCNRANGGNREGFRMPARRERSIQYRGPASESLRRTNPREAGEQLAVYGDLVGRRLWRGMFFARSLRVESR